MQTLFSFSISIFHMYISTTLHSSLCALAAVRTRGGGGLHILLYISWNVQCLQFIPLYPATGAVCIESTTLLISTADLKHPDCSVCPHHGSSHVWLYQLQCGRAAFTGSSTHSSWNIALEDSMILVSFTMSEGFSATDAIFLSKTLSFGVPDVFSCWTHK